MLSKDTYPDFEQAVKNEVETFLSGKPWPEPSYVRRGIFHETVETVFQLFHRKPFLVMVPSSSPRLRFLREQFLVTPA